MDYGNLARRSNDWKHRADYGSNDKELGCLANTIQGTCNYLINNHCRIRMAIR